MLKKMTGGEALVHTLLAHGVDSMFGIPGTHNLAIYDALLSVPGIRHITARHEQGAGFMADGYARASGKVGVCLSTSGPGALNMLVPAATAYSDSSPVLCISSDVPSSWIGRQRGFLHECPDQLAGFLPVTTQCYRPMSVTEIPWSVSEAFRRMKSGRARPAAIQIPFDVLADSAEVAVPPPASLLSSIASPDELARAAQLLESAKRPVIWAGGGVIAASAPPALVRLAELLECPVFTTVMGKGAIPADHRLVAGSLVSHPIARSYLESCDLLLAVGTRFTELETASWSMKLPGQLVQVDIDPREIGRNYPVSAAVVGDAGEVLVRLADALTSTASRPDRSEEVSQLRESIRQASQKRSPEAVTLMDTLRTSMPRDTIVVNDLTLAVYWSWLSLPIYEPRTYIYPNGFGTLGFALPAAIGAKIAQPNRPVVALCGDGGFMFNCQELAVAKQSQVPVVIIVFNDNAYGVLRPEQIRRYGRATAVDLVNPDFAALARSFEIPGEQVSTIKALGSAVSRAIDAEETRLIELKISLPWPLY